jgi:hypothetical protein
MPLGNKGTKSKQSLARKSSTVVYDLSIVRQPEVRGEISPRIMYCATYGASNVVKEAALPLWANFRQRVLDVAIAEINKTTDLNLEIESWERSDHRISVLTFTNKTQERPPEISIRFAANLLAFAIPTGSVLWRSKQTARGGAKS